MPEAVWSPSNTQISNANITRYMQFVANKYECELTDYYSLHQWSVKYPEIFWESIFLYFNIKNSCGWECVLKQKSGMFRSVWFEGAKLSYAENLLSSHGHNNVSNTTALEFHNENNEIKNISYEELYKQVSCLSQSLKLAGVMKGDRVAAVVPNIPEAIVSMLAVNSLGAIWASCSPDFGLQAMLDRFQQIEPKVLIYADGYYYNGKSHFRTDVINQLSSQLPSIQLSVLIPYLKSEIFYACHRDEYVLFSDLTDNVNTNEKIDFEQTEFSDPLYILFSSGTTGVPKCIVHGVGGTLLQHIKELSLHLDLKSGDKLFFYTSTGWMMWNWMLSSLFLGVTLVLYDGSPLFPKADSLLKLVDANEISVFGCGAKYISSLQKNNVNKNIMQLEKLRLILSTGSPLLSESFDYVYENIKPSVQLCSISGGTDIVSCFVLGNPLGPVYRGEIQCAGLGMNVQVWDEHANSVVHEKGELVCVTGFPSMPVCFWNDTDDSLYYRTYFDKFKGVWSQGDYAEVTEHHGFIIYGRSDATLNPCGIRIGTAEIYRQLENNKQIVDSLVVAQKWASDQRIILFVQLKSGITLDHQIINDIKQHIKLNASIHHVPARIIQVRDIPRTYSGKIAEIAVTKIIHNEVVENIDALINPESLDQFMNMESLNYD